MIEVHFESIHRIIIQHIQSSAKSIKICVAWFTDVDIYNSLLLAQKKGAAVKVIIANHEFNVNSRIDFKELLSNGASVSYIGNLNSGIGDKLMHNKFCIIDDETVIAGSYNWTYKARKNDENILIIRDKKTVSTFDSKFNSLQPKYGFAVSNNEVHLWPIEKIMTKWDKPEVPVMKNKSEGRLRDIFSKF